MRDVVPDLMLRARREEIAGPLFDVMLLGIGADAHVASIFPESPLLGRRPDQPSRFALQRSADASAEAEGRAACPH